MTRQILLSKTVPAAVLVSTCLLAAKIDYHDPSELASALNALRQSSAHVQMLTIGYSPSIPSGSSVTRYPIKAVRIETIHRDEHQGQPGSQWHSLRMWNAPA